MSTYVRTIQVNVLLIIAINFIYYYSHTRECNLLMPWDLGLNEYSIYVHSTEAAPQRPPTIYLFMYYTTNIARTIARDEC